VGQEGAGGDGEVVAWFDDHLEHNIAPVDSTSQYSLRIDGRFTREARARICRKGSFGARTGGAANVLAKQTRGPAFLVV
jgi:hypothetical protein